MSHTLAVALALSLSGNTPVAEPAAASRSESAGRPLRTIGFLVLPGVYNSELMAPFDVLHHLRFRMDKKLAPAVFTVSPEHGPLRTFEGLTILPNYTFDDAPPIELLVIPSAENNMGSDLADERLIAWVRKTGTEARWILSLCDGAFLLAKAGLLDGHEATTFPGDQDALEKMFPKVELVRDVVFVHDGKAVTGVGGARSYEPAFYLVELLYGTEVARKNGPGLVIDWNLAKVPHRIGARATRPTRDDDDTHLAE